MKALKAVFFAHVRSRLEYASVVWAPYYQIHDDRIESIQKKFVMYALRHSVRRDANYRLPPYVDRCGSIGMETLSRRRLNLSAMFVFDLLRGRVDSSELRSKLRINVPSRQLRCEPFLILDSHRTNYGLYEPVNSVARAFNIFSDCYDRNVTRQRFRSSVRSKALSDSVLRRHGFLIRAR